MHGSKKNLTSQIENWTSRPVKLTNCFENGHNPFFFAMELILLQNITHFKFKEYGIKVRHWQIFVQIG
jgi:hypothetical protein